jgi:hypothetical protein
MNYCPKFNKKAFEETLDKLDIKSELKSLSEKCDLPKSKSKRTTMSKRTRKGGYRYFSESNIKILLYIIIAVISGLATTTRTFDNIMVGLEMLANGECTSILNTIWGTIGLENPVCVKYNKLMAAILLALQGDLRSRAELIGYASMVIAGPVTINAGINAMAKQISNRVYSQYAAIENSDDLSEQRIMIENSPTSSRSSRKNRSPTPRPPSDEFSEDDAAKALLSLRSR